MQIRKNWYVGEIQVACHSAKRGTLGREVLVNKLIYLVQATDPKEAHRKLEILGRAMDGLSPCESDVSHKFIGISALTPVYDELGDGCELIDYETVPVPRFDMKSYQKTLSQKIKSMMKNMQNIEKKRVSAGYAPMWK